MRGFLAACLLLQHLDASLPAGLGKSDENSGITYVQIKPLIQSNVQQADRTVDFPRSSRIENVPLQIRPTAVHPHPHPEAVRTPRSDGGDVREVAAEDYVDQNNESEARFDTSEAVTPSTTDGEDYKPETIISTPQDNDLFKLSEYHPKGEQTSQQNSLVKYGRPNKLSKKHYGLNFDSVAPSYRKYLETRQFRSRCRCERIWNCPKLQVTVPRCPVDYFMCCF